jgi:hypothetical protein
MTEIGVETLQTARAFAALPAAGAWDTTPTVLWVSGADRVLLHLSYTRGAAGGAVDYQVQVSPYSLVALVPTGAAEWLTAAVYLAGTLAAGSDVASDIQREYVTYQATGAAQEAWTFGPISSEGQIERLRVVARESGAVATPGSFGVTVSTS